MTIEQEGINYVLYCDNCFEEAEESFKSWREAVAHKTDNGWKSQRDITWQNVCPNCKKTDRSMVADMCDEV